MNDKILIIIDHEEGRISTGSYELAAAARAIAPREVTQVLAVMAGYNASGAAETFAAETGLEVVLLEHQSLLRYSTEGYLRAFSDFLPSLEPGLILAAHNPRGCDFAPALALRLKLSCVTAVEDIREDDKGKAFTRTAWHGKVREETRFGDKPTIATIMPGAYAFEKCGEKNSGSLTVKQVNIRLEQTLSSGSLPSGVENAALSTAEVVISAGRGVKKPETMALLSSLLEFFPRSALGASRGACDLGLADYSAQVGLTGKTVAPKLYIAFGISGASQHTAGMKGARIIVAINNDPHAPIFSLSHLGIVDNIERFLPALIDVLKNRLGT